MSADEPFRRWLAEGMTGCQFAKPSQPSPLPTLPNHSHLLAVSWRPKTLHVVALEVGFRVGLSAAEAALDAFDDAAHDFPRPFFARVGTGFLSCFAVSSNAASIMRGFASCSAW